MFLSFSTNRKNTCPLLAARVNETKHRFIVQKKIKTLNTCIFLRHLKASLQLYIALIIQALFFLSQAVCKAEGSVLLAVSASGFFVQNFDH